MHETAAEGPAGAVTWQATMATGLALREPTCTAHHEGATFCFQHNSMRLASSHRLRCVGLNKQAGGSQAVLEVDRAGVQFGAAHPCRTSSQLSTQQLHGMQMHPSDRVYHAVMSGKHQPT